MAAIDIDNGFTLIAVGVGLLAVGGFFLSRPDRDWELAIPAVIGIVFVVGGIFRLV